MFVFLEKLSQLLCLTAVADYNGISLVVQLYIFIHVGNFFEMKESFFFQFFFFFNFA